MMVIENKFEIGQIVYLKTDKDQYQRIVISILISARGLMYDLCAGETLSTHHEFEIQSEMNELIKMK
jgi:hypothetical protein